MEKSNNCIVCLNDNNNYTICNNCNQSICKNCINESPIYVKNKCNCNIEFIEHIKNNEKELYEVLKKDIETNFEYEIGDKNLEIKELKNKLSNKELSEKMYSELQELLFLRCPWECNTIIDDFDGCNAITCDECKKEFCAICFEKCGDAHDHIRKNHSGKLFKKSLFEDYKENHRNKIFKDYCYNKSLEETNMLKARFFEKYERKTNEIRVDKFKDDMIEILENIIENKDFDKINNTDKIRLICTSEEKPIKNGTINILKLIIQIFIIDDDKNTRKWENIDNKNENIVPENLLIEYDNLKSYLKLKNGILISNINEEYEINNKIIEFYDDYFIVKCIKEYDREYNNLQIWKKNDKINPIIKTFIGARQPEPIITDIIEKKKFNENLNEYQQKILNLNELNDVNIIEGPPGTGKSYMITALIQKINNELSDFNIILLSEKNGAIGAVMEHLNNRMLEDEELLFSLISFGSENANEITKKYFKNNKLNYYSKYIDINIEINNTIEIKKKYNNNIEKIYKSELNNLEDFLKENNFNYKNLLDIIKNFIFNNSIDKEQIKFLKIEDCKNKIYEDNLNKFKEYDIDKDFKREDLETMEIDTIEFDNFIKLMEENNQIVQNNFEEKKFLNLIEENIISIINEDIIEENNKKKEKTKEEIEQKIKIIKDFFKEYIYNLIDIFLMCNPIVNNIKILNNQIQELNKEKNNIKKDFEDKCDEKQNIFTSTIGSLNRLLEHFEIIKNIKKTIVIIDEGSTIPIHELGTLSLIKQKIISLVLVGDPNQLPPFGKLIKNNNSKYNKYNKEITIPSIFDKKYLKVKSNHLEMQYRIPFEIAEILNKYVYNNKYNTIETKKYCLDTVRIINSTTEDIKKENINEGEADKVVKIYNKYKYEYKSIMILSPYKNQVKLIKQKLDNIQNVVYSIDQSQGKECDLTILSMTKNYPTSFMNKERTVVALSRAKNKLIVICNKQKILNTERIFDKTGISKNIFRELIENNSI